MTYTSDPSFVKPDIYEASKKLRLHGRQSAEMSLEEEKQLWDQDFRIFLEAVTEAWMKANPYAVTKGEGVDKPDLTTELACIVKIPLAFWDGTDTAPLYDWAAAVKTVLDRHPTLTSLLTLGNLFRVYIIYPW